MCWCVDVLMCSELKNYSAKCRTLTIIHSGSIQRAFFSIKSDVVFTMMRVNVISLCWRWKVGFSKISTLWWHVFYRSENKKISKLFEKNSKIFFLNESTNKHVLLLFVVSKLRFGAALSTVGMLLGGFRVPFTLANLIISHCVFMNENHLCWCVDVLLCFKLHCAVHVQYVDFSFQAFFGL